MAPPSSSAASAAAWDAASLDELLDDAANETDEVLMELLGETPASGAWTAPLAEDELHAPRSVGERASNTKATTPRQTSPSRPHKPLNKKKQAIANLHAEVAQLTTELQRLRSEASTAMWPHSRTAKETAVDERRKRRRVEEEGRQLRASVYAQTQLLRGLKFVFSPPATLSAIDLSRFLHSYTRLPRNRSTRRNEYKALAHEGRFQLAMDMLCRETRDLALSADQRFSLPSRERPFIQKELLPHHDGFSTTSTNVYTLETENLTAALRGVCVAVREIFTRSHAYDSVSRKAQIVDPDAALPASNGAGMIYQIMDVDHRDPRDGDELAIESRNVTLYKQTDDYALLLEDFVDDDELHPQDEATSITRQVVAAYLLRQELCEDGSYHTVVRALRTRRYRFHEHTPSATLQRFQLRIDRTTQDSDLLFRDIIQQSIAHEERAFAQASKLMRVVRQGS